jgi:hypothetical protein
MKTVTLRRESARNQLAAFLADREEQPMNIGKPQREIVVEPLEIPIPQREQPAPAPRPQDKPKEVPA